ncbi:xanthine dehydrogenase family protein molybdopterin-binding subunit [Dehalobacterium formicoaceticum]|uniref:xanthine dehydrogenase family protein molybdopterin-binding subunit n=1 Tax=Dehalobacterium formicoaceticum TaxID=51515 RepID=UPI000B7CED4C|nr:molybdopterin cofactor-binding domain-containing protein [Dehalobacterium formicoaceticum]
MQTFNIVGKNIRRNDALEKVTGTATFSSDLNLPGMLHGKVLRSPHPHAKILSIDTSEAEKYPGVKAVATWENTPRVLFNTSASMTFTVPHLTPVLDQYIFDQVVRYVGDEVAAVAAVSEEAAAEALKLIKVEYELLPAVFDPLDAIREDAPIIHESKTGKNISGEIVNIQLGDTEAGFAECDLVLEETFKLPVQKQVQLETQAAVARVGTNGEITVYSTTQTPHPSKMILAGIFGIPQSKVRVLNPPYVGGGFGVRIGLSAKAEPIAVALAQLSGHPVKVVYSREEDFIASDTRHGGYVTIKLGAKKDGTFHAIQLQSRLNGGAYCSFGGEVPGVLGAMGLSVYRIPHQSYQGYTVYTNRTPAGAMRGFGNPQAMFAIESMVDMMAEKLGMDLLELHRKNIMQVGDTWCLPYACSSTGLMECMEKAAQSIGWERRGKLNQPGDTKRRGIGMGVGTHVSNSWPFCVDYDNALITIQQDGSVLLSSGVPDIGTGTTTTLPQLAAEVLGISMEQIYMTFADTLTTPFDIGSHASRTLYAAGTAVIAAAQDAKQQILEYAADLLDTPAERLDIKEGMVHIQGQPFGICYGSDACKMGNAKFTSITLKDLAYYAHLRNKQFIGVGRIIPANAPPWHAHFVEVEVDTETGVIQIIKVAAAHDVGRAINPKIVEGQIEGGVVMGLGYALGEEILVDDKGKPQHTGIHKYFLPTAMDIPEIDAMYVESIDPTGPFGAKGVGECGLVPTAPAVATAVFDAIGIRFTEIPMTPERVYKKIKEQKGR